jgi:hypothetical protein
LTLRRKLQIVRCQGVACDADLEAVVALPPRPSDPGGN